MPDVATLRTLIEAEARAARERDEAARERHAAAERQAQARHEDVQARFADVDGRLDRVEGQARRGFADQRRDRAAVETLTLACTSRMDDHLEAHRTSIWTATPLAWLWSHRRAVGLLLLGAAAAGASPGGRELLRTYALPLLARMAP